jgi:hypothetical protein
MRKWKGLLMNTIKLCEYDHKTPANSECFVCGIPLCSMCGYIVAGKKVCNDCYEDSEYCHEGHLRGGCYQCKMD